MSDVLGIDDEWIALDLNLAMAERLEHYEIKKAVELQELTLSALVGALTGGGSKKPTRRATEHEYV